MIIVTVNLPSIYVDAIAKLTEMQVYESRSDAIRDALRDFLKKELEMVENLLDLSETAKDNMTLPGTKKVGEKKIDMRVIRAGWPDQQRAKSSWDNRNKPGRKA